MYTYYIRSKFQKITKHDKMCDSANVNGILFLFKFKDFCDD